MARYTENKIAEVWSGHPVGFCLVTHKGVHYAAYYDADRRMTVAWASVGSEDWCYFIVPSKKDGPPTYKTPETSTILGWDSHNSVTMTFDDADQLHLCGNMHCHKLTYFRTTKPLDVPSLRQVDAMVGRNEDSCTYPVFMRGSRGELIFRYRDGYSGNGVDFYNTYDPETQKWRRLIEQPLLDGLDRMNAYARMPELGPDGRYHLVWMWRDDYRCETNHTPSYARSDDLVNWETSRGEPLQLPITIENGEVIDPVPVGGGVINMSLSLGFDADNRPVVSYHKYDSDGKSQAYSARLEGSSWKVYQTSDWIYRWNFDGGGAVPAEIRIGAVKPNASGGLEQSYHHILEGSGLWTLDPDTLKPVGEIRPVPPALPEVLMAVRSDWPGMNVRTLAGMYDASGDKRYFLRWETLGPNRDKPRETAPQPVPLTLVAVAD